MPHEQIVHGDERVLDGPPEVAEVRLAAAAHGGEAEDEVALADVVADAVAVHDEGAEAHERLGGAAHLEAGGRECSKFSNHPRDQLCTVLLAG